MLTDGRTDGLAGERARRKRARASSRASSIGADHFSIGRDDVRESAATTVGGGRAPSARGRRPVRRARLARVAVRAHHARGRLRRLAVHRLPDHQPGARVHAVHAHPVDAGE